MDKSEKVPLGTNLLLYDDAIRIGVKPMIDSTDIKPCCQGVAAKIEVYIDRFRANAKALDIDKISSAGFQHAANALQEVMDEIKTPEALEKAPGKSNKKCIQDLTESGHFRLGDMTVHGDWEK